MVPFYRILALTVVTIWLGHGSFLCGQDSASGPDLLLHEFRPQSRLKTVDHTPLAAAFPVIDIHTHFSIRFKQDPEALEAFIKTMDRNHIAVCCCLDAALNASFDSHLDYLWKSYPSRFAFFANIDFRGDGVAVPSRTTPSSQESTSRGTPQDIDYSKWACNQPDFVHRTVLQLQEAHRRGICGLKFFKGFGLEYRNADGSWLAIDDPRFDPIFQTCGELGIPVIMHTADPSAFFQPIDPKNERYEELHRHPDWAFPSPPFPSRDSLHEARSRLIARHSKTIFIAAHLGNDAEDLAQCAQWLNQHPNLYLEIASRISELGRQPRAAREFLETYADRVLFGTDGPWPESRLRIYWRFLETSDEYFPYSEKEFPPQGFWNIYGLQLSEDTLKKLYYENAIRIVPGMRAKWEAWNESRTPAPSPANP